MADGWHPYFKSGETINNLQLEFQSREMLEFSEGLVPTGKSVPYFEFNSMKNINDTFFDNSFTLNFAERQPMCLLRDPVQRIQVEIRPDKSYPYLQVYTPPHRKSIALENLSAAPNAFNNQMGLITMEPGEIRKFQTQYKISSWA
jgi:aldose 1-epimerase